MRISTFFIFTILMLPIVAQFSQAVPNRMLVEADGQVPHNMTAKHSSGSISISLSQDNLTLVRGSEVSLIVSVMGSSLRPSRVNLIARGFPIGTNVTFSPSSGRASFSSIMTISSSDSTPLGESNLTILAIAIGHEKSVTLFLQVLPVTYNLSVLSAIVPPNATVGNVVNVSVEVANHGSRSKTFSVDLYANGTIVAETPAIRLSPLANYTASLQWNTTGFASGEYKIVISLPPVPEEINLGNSSLDAGRVLLQPISKSKPNPLPPVSEKPALTFVYGREIAVAAAIGELVVVLLLFVRRGAQRAPRLGQTTGRR